MGNIRSFSYVNVRGGAVVSITTGVALNVLSLDGAPAEHRPAPTITAPVLDHAGLREAAEEIVIAQAGALVDGDYDDDGALQDTIETAQAVYSVGMRRLVYGALLLAGPIEWLVSRTTLEATLTAALSLDWVRARMLYSPPLPVNDINQALHELEIAGLVIGDDNGNFEANMPDDYYAFAPEALLDQIDGIVEALRAQAWEFGGEPVEPLDEIPF